ncbi:MAG TPA: GntR family transcriptional regulator [Acetobacteraceae bacterium]|nr:GntR family transcriptional regulator [Acetobacteraceae bacterium]
MAFGIIYGCTKSASHCQPCRTGDYTGLRELPVIRHRPIARPHLRHSGKFSIIGHSFQPCGPAIQSLNRPKGRSMRHSDMPVQPSGTALPAAPRTTQIERSSLADAAREEILRRILDGEIQPGERIIELRLAQELGTSQAPVREALRALEVLGVVECSRNRGARARLLDSRELAEISDVRAEIEGYAASLATKRLKGDTAELETHLAAMLNAAGTADVRRFAEANHRFHRHIVETAGNATLFQIWIQLDVKVHTVMNVLRSHKDLRDVALSHQPVIDAIRARDARAARLALRHHILGHRPNP